MKDMGDIHQKYGRSGLFEQAQESFNRTAREESQDQEANGSATNATGEADSKPRASSPNGSSDAGRKNASNGNKSANATHWKLPPMVDVMDFIQTPLPKPPQLIHGVLDKGSKMVISGNSKGRKTWNLLHLAICVATGMAWWG